MQASAIANAKSFRRSRSVVDLIVRLLVSKAALSRQHLAAILLPLANRTYKAEPCRLRLAMIA